MNPTVTVEADAMVTFHPRFASPDGGDVVLRSLDGTLFRVHSYTLRAASGLFKTMFSLPQPKKKPCATGGYRVPGTITISIYESSFMLAQLLPYLTGKLPARPLQSLDLPSLTRLLFLAEKWDTPGPISLIRNALNSSHSLDATHLCSPYSPFCSSSPLAAPPALSSQLNPNKPPGPGPLTGYFRSHPVHLYVLSRHFRWREEAERAAVSLLAMTSEELEKRWAEVQNGVSYDAPEADSESEEEEEKEHEAGEVDATMFMITNKDWESILELRKRRCDTFKALLDSRERFTAGNNPNYTCVRCGYVKLDNSRWDTLKGAMIAELERRPLGDTLLSAMTVPAGLDAAVPDAADQNPDTNPDADTDTVPPLAESAAVTVAATTPAPAPTPASTPVSRIEGEPWPELISCFKARCPRKGCGAANYDPLATLRQIRRCVEELPWKLSWDEASTADV